MSDSDESLALRFRESEGRPIQLAGRWVYLNYDLPRLGDVPLTVRLSARDDRVHALCLSAEGGVLEVAGQRSRDIVLWTDSAPPEVVVVPVPKRGNQVRVRLWNAWRSDPDVLNAGVGNCGMLVEQMAGRAALRCSAGPGPVDFDEFLVEIDGEEIRGRAD